MEKLNKQKHQEEIERSHTRGFGGSDARMILRLAECEQLNKGDIERLRVIAGLDVQTDFFTTPAMECGHRFEDWFEAHHLHNECTREKFIELKNNPYQFNVFAHCDFVEKNFNNVYELKFSQKPLDEVIKTYMPQLQWYYLLGMDHVILYVGSGEVHNSEYYNDNEFKPDNVSAVSIPKDKKIIEKLENGLSKVQTIWLPWVIARGDDYIKEDKSTPTAINELIDDVAISMLKIKELENEVEAKKTEILEYMKMLDIAVIDSDGINSNGAKVYYSSETVSNVFDKSLLFKEHPELNESDYQKKSKRKEFLKIQVK